jgi:antitoxin PrlF
MVEERMHTTLTSKGQITLPKALREKLSLSAGDRVEFFMDDENSVRLVVKHVPVIRMKGMLPRPERPVSLEEMDRAILEKSQNS